MKNNGLTALVEKLSAEKEVRTCINVTKRDDLRLNGQPSEVWLLLVHAIYHYINYPNMAPVFNGFLVCKAGLSALSQLREIYDTLDKTTVPTFRDFMEIPMKAAPTLYQSVKIEFMNTLRFVESGSGESRGKMTSRSRN